MANLPLALSYLQHVKDASSFLETEISVYLSLSVSYRDNADRTLPTNAFDRGYRRRAQREAHRFLKYAAQCMVIWHDQQPAALLAAVVLPPQKRLPATTGSQNTLEALR